MRSSLLPEVHLAGEAWASRARLSLVGCILLLAVGECTFSNCRADDQTPRLSDESLQITLFARDPMVVTPVGIAAHPHGGVVVIESHTHSPPKDYAGPKHDRLLWIRDTNGDGQADQVEVFADGFNDAMNVVITAATGSSRWDAFVIQRTGVVRLEDRSGAGLADHRTTIVRLQTPESYDHSTLLGLCMDDAGNVFMSRGNTGGNRFRWEGSDGSGYSGHGDGGDVAVCDRDGKHLRRYATGFRNPFGLHWDRRGWLLCADNDPDAVGPNRIVHLVPGGDYGFRSAYGGAGNWPLSAWNGELPGTLPILAGVGEAPGTMCSAIDADLPSGYERDTLVAVWGEHRVDRVRIGQTDAGLRGEVLPWIEGESNFRPVAVAVGGDGAVYITDWVKKDYPNHGEGRIWRVSRRVQNQQLKAETSVPFEPPAIKRDPYVTQLDEIASTAVDRPEALDSALRASDPFVRAAAVWAWSSADPKLRRAAASSDEAAVRLAMLLAMRRGGDVPSEERWVQWLSDPSPEVRIAALSWAADSRQSKLRQVMAKALAQRPVDARLVQIYLAADQAVSPEMIALAEQGQRWMGVKRQYVPETVDRLLGESHWNDDVVAALLSVAGPPDRKALKNAVVRSLDSASRSLRQEAIYSLGQLADDECRLIDLATEIRRDAEDRADAIANLKEPVEAHRETLIKLLADAEPIVVRQTVRRLRDLAEQSEVQNAVAQLWNQRASLDQRVVDELDQWPLKGAVVDRPRDWDQWRNIALGEGDVQAGRRAFFSSRAQCSRCHLWNGRGGGVGPNLSGIGAGHSAEQLLRALLYPSEGIAPEYASHTILTEDGQVHTGIQFHFRSGGSAISILTMEGKELSFPIDEVETYRANQQSLMPEDLVDHLSVGEIRDIIAMLAESAPETTKNHHSQ
jgi:putative membrane-bound dehydrogenase-like protein